MACNCGFLYCHDGERLKPRAVRRPMLRPCLRPLPRGKRFFPFLFDVDQPTDAARQPVEVQLLVSHDKGAHWQLYARALPNQKQIPFRTATDGEYWFAVRTVDRAGKFHPETITGPGLRVIVDTTPPEMQLSAQCGQAGQINVQWQINEIHPKSESLSIQYRLSPDGPWQTVAVVGKEFHRFGKYANRRGCLVAAARIARNPNPRGSERRGRQQIGQSCTSENRSRCGAQSRAWPRWAIVMPMILSNRLPEERAIGQSLEHRRFTRRAQCRLGINPPIGNRYQASGEMRPIRNCDCFRPANGRR